MVIECLGPNFPKGGPGRIRIANVRLDLFAQPQDKVASGQFEVCMLGGALPDHCYKASMHD